MWQRSRSAQRRTTATRSLHLRGSLGHLRLPVDVTDEQRIVRLGASPPVLPRVDLVARIVDDRPGIVRDAVAPERRPSESLNREPRAGLVARDAALREL